MFGKTENKCLLELFQCPKLDKETFENIFNPSSEVRGPYRERIIFDSGFPLIIKISAWPNRPFPYIAYVIHILVGGVEEHDLTYDMDGYDMDMGLIRSE